MPVFTIQPVNITASVEKDSPGQTLSASITDIVIQLTDGNGSSTPAANSDWLKTTGNILQWGVQMSTDGGSTWNYVIWESNIPFGHLTRGGLLPALEWGGSEIEGNA